MTDEVEEWRPVTGWEGLYEVSSLGRVRSVERIEKSANRWGEFVRPRAGRIIVGWISRRGYHCVRLCRDGKITQRYTHQLVCEGFHGTCPNEVRLVAHFDGDPLNNRSDNLRWATAAENADDKARHLRAGKKLTPDQAAAIRASDLTQRQAALKWGVSKTVIGSIRRGDIWRYA